MRILIAEQITLLEMLMAKLVVRVLEASWKDGLGTSSLSYGMCALFMTPGS